MSASAPPERSTSDKPILFRGAAGGVLMGLANLVPGISGGTMLLATGVYPAFITAVADLTTLRFRREAMVLLAAVVGAAVVAILLLAGAVKDLVVNHRWIMYSIFIGLTLGGVPLVWRMVKRRSPAVAIGAAVGFGVMLVMVGGIDTRGPGGEPDYVLLTVAGLAGASAMILPGISGAYVLLLLGQYEPILTSVDQLKRALIGNPASGLGPEWGLAVDSLPVLIPVGIGLVIGVLAVSNLVRWLLTRFQEATLGVLLGLLVGAVVGLWPFQSGVPPNPGDVIDGVSLTARDIALLDPAEWAVHFFQPTLGQVLGAIGLLGFGLAVTLLIDRIGRLSASAGRRAGPVGAPEGADVI